MGCEIFERNCCLGCEALSPELNIDRLKYQCEKYLELTKYEKGKQINFFGGSK